MDRGELGHCLRVRVYYPDTDHSGVVYHGRYLDYFERAREELLGVATIRRLLAQGIGFVVYQVHMRCRRSAVYGDQLEVRTATVLHNDYQLRFHHKLYRADELLVDAEVVLASVDSTGELVALPNEVVRVAQLEP